MRNGFLLPAILEQNPDFFKHFFKFCS